MMDLIVSWLCSAIAEAFQMAVSLFSSLFGYDIKLFNETFSYAATAYDIIRKVGLALALILAAWQIIVFFTRGAEKAPSTPIRAALNAVIAVGFIYYGNYLFESILNFCQSPYDALLSADAVQWGANWDWSGGITEGIKNAFSGSSMLLMLIMLILVCFSFVKLLLEIVERYVVTFVLVYLSPLASSTLASSTTSGIYKKYFTMFISQCLLLFLNAWCLKMACSALSTSNNDNSVVLSLIICYAFLRVSAKMDSYINQLGLNAAITGGGLGAEIFAAGHSLLGGGGGGGNGSGNNAGSKILGASKTVQTWTNRYNPFAAAATIGKDAIVGAAKGGSEAFRSGAVAEAHGRMGKFKTAAAGVVDGAKSGIAHSDTVLTNFVQNTDLRDKTAKTFNSAKNVVNDAKNKLRDENTHPALNPILTNIPDIPDVPATQSGHTRREEENALAMTHPTSQNLASVAGSEARANSIFKQAQTDHFYNEDWTESSSVSAVMQGLGLDKHSKEVAECINAGYGRDGAQNVEYSLDRSGIHTSYDLNGCRHKTDVVDSSQYRALSTQERAGFEKAPKSSGSQYYVRSTKTQLNETKPSKDDAAQASK